MDRTARAGRRSVIAVGRRLTPWEAGYRGGVLGSWAGRSATLSGVSGQPLPLWLRGSEPDNGGFVSEPETNTDSGLHCEAVAGEERILGDIQSHVLTEHGVNAR